MPKGLFKNKAAEHKAQAKNEKKKAKRLAFGIQVILGHGKEQKILIITATQN